MCKPANEKGLFYITKAKKFSFTILHLAIKILKSALSIILFACYLKPISYVPVVMSTL
jgi:hypothetical protein